MLMMMASCTSTPLFLSPVLPVDEDEPSSLLSPLCRSYACFPSPISAPPPPPLTRNTAIVCYDWSDIPLQGDSSFVTMTVPQPRTTTQQKKEKSRIHHHTSGTASSDPSVQTATTIQTLHYGSDCSTTTTATTRRRRQQHYLTSPVSSMDCNGLLWGDTSTTTTTMEKHDPLSSDQYRLPSVVSFADHVTVRTYSVIVGDHPACELPMQLGMLESEEYIPFGGGGGGVDDENETATCSNVPPPHQRRHTRLQPLSYEERLEVIQASTGLSEAELRQQEYDILVSHHY